MKRKEFIRNISLVGVGTSLAPTQLFAFSDKSRIALPNHAVHIPHGNFANTNLERIRIAELDVEVSVQHFMRTGIETDQKDISVFTFHKNGQLLTVCFDNDGCHHSGELVELKTSIGKNRIVLSDNRFEVELKAGSSYLSFRKV
jgi:hypothetical protein